MSEFVVVAQVKTGKSEYVSPEPLSRRDAEKALEVIRSGGDDEWVPLDWLAVRRRDVVAARIEQYDGPPTRTAEELIARLKELGVLREPQ